MQDFRARAPPQWVVEKGGGGRDGHEAEVSMHARVVVVLSPFAGFLRLRLGGTGSFVFLKKVACKLKGLKSGGKAALKRKLVIVS